MVSSCVLPIIIGMSAESGEASGAKGSRGSTPPSVTGEYRLGDVRHIVASPERARIELGFRAEITPDEGLARFADAPLRA